MRKISKLVLLLLLVVAAVITMAACDNTQGNQPVVDEISVTDANMPQLMYIIGQDLDLSNGFLTVKIGEEVQEIPMTSEGVTNTGFDKNKLGEQTITITYGGKTTQITVTVVDRMQVVEYATDYLVGDAFDVSKGRLMITRNDGSNFPVVLNAEGVTVTGFDSTKTGEQTLTVKYEKDGESYSTTFKVTVYAVENVEFHAPKKQAYNSHDTGMDLTDGYFTLTGKGGALTKTVALEEAMISGFDLTAVNEDNSPFNQELTVTYNGKTYNYSVKLTYTVISKFQKEAAAFVAFDWANEELSVEMGELALDLMASYMELSPAQKNYINKGDALAVARAALVHGLNLITPELDAMQDAFIIDGGLEFTVKNREAVEAAIAILGNDECNLYRVSSVLEGLVVEFANEEAFDGDSFANYEMLPSWAYEQLLEIFETMIETDDLVQAMVDWQTAGIENRAAEIEELYTYIFSSEYIDSVNGMPQIFAYVFAWYIEGDEPEHITEGLYYHYYLQNDMEALTNLPVVGLPSELSYVAYYLSMAMEQIGHLAQQMQPDTTQMLYYYYMAEKTVNELKENGSELDKALYEIVPVNSLLGLVDNSTLFSFDLWMDYVRSMEGGFDHYCGAMMGIEEFENLLYGYLELLDKWFTIEGYEESEEYGATLQELFRMYVDLDPTQQYYFLTTLNSMYTMSVPPLAFDDSDEQIAPYLCVLVQLLNEYYREMMGNDHQLYTDLVIAMEIYANRASRGGWAEEFTTKMDAIRTRYNAMTEEEKAIFDQYLGHAYTKYIAIRDTYVGVEEKVDLGEWADKFAELDAVLENLEMTAQLMQNNYSVYSLFFTAYERAALLVNEIKAGAPEEILEAFKFEDRYGEDLLVSYEYLMTTYRTIYVSSLLTIGTTYEGYTTSNLPAFLNEVYDVIWGYMTSEEGAPLDKAAAIAAMKTFRELTLDERILFIIMEGDNGQYYISLDAVFEQNFSEAGAALGNKVLELETMVILYEYFLDMYNEALAQDNAETAAELLASVEAAQDSIDAAINGEGGIKAMYEALSDEDKADFADLQEMYDYYMDMCEEILNTEEAAA